MPAHARLAAAAALAVLCAAPRAGAEPLTPEQRAERAARIRDVAADNGISAGYLLAGIAQAETNLSHCWSELDWACQGPDSPDCAGPVVAGAGDGPCSAMQGGLGMFQFDGGTFDETIARDGDGVLLLAGNVTRAVDFVVNMVMGSQYVDPEVDTPAEAKAWMNQVTVDGALWDAWISTVTHYYNGCTPTGCSVYDERYQHYADAGALVFDEQGADFWEVELPPCAAVPPEGRLLEETDTCFTKGGPLPYWRVGIGGESNLHVWTGTTDLAEPVNFAEWSLTFEEAGEYRVEVSVPDGGTTPQARYTIEHAGGSEEVVLDQSAVSGFAELGSFAFAAGGEQRVFVADNTGDATDERLVIDALRVTRLDLGAGGAGSGGNGAGGASAGGQSAGGEGQGGEDGDGGGDAGCDCSLAARGPQRGGPALAFAALLGAALARRRRR